VEEIRGRVTREWVERSLHLVAQTKPGSNLRWDPDAERNRALMGVNPTDDGTVVNAPLEWLAFRSLPAFPCVRRDWTSTGRTALPLAVVVVRGDLRDGTLAPGVDGGMGRIPKRRGRDRESPYARYLCRLRFRHPPYRAGLRQFWSGLGARLMPAPRRLS
jgi:hypothetical protein